MKIIMIDQDGVVYNENYQATADISESVNFINGKTDSLIVPNTDTPISRIRYNLRVMMNYNPEIIIAERGAVVQINGKKQYIKPVSGIKQYVWELKNKFDQANTVVEIGNSATWIRERKLFAPNSKLLLIDEFREQTVGFYMKITDDNGLPFTDNNWSREAMKVIETVPLPSGLNAPDYNADYGIAICNVAGVSKTDGYLILKERYPGAQFFMIGNSDADIIGDRNVVHCAVANASAGLKEKSVFVSGLPYTKGLKQCLEWIIQGYKL